ncbi:MAG: ATP-binding cassette domain-containing protein [Shimia sp.]
MQHSPASYAAALKALILPVIALGSVTNLAVLISPIFMMQVLDRVIPSGNLATLGLLALLAAGALIATAVIEALRDQAIGRASVWFEKMASSAVVRGHSAQIGEGLGRIGPIRDALRRGTAATMADMPWVPLFIIAILLIHPIFLVLLAVGVALTALVRLAEHIVSETARSTVEAGRSEAFAHLDRLNHQGAGGMLMGLHTNLTARYCEALSGASEADRALAGHEAILSSLGRMIRSFIQVATLALGAFLVTRGELSAGGMIGASIVLGKTIATIEQGLVSWPAWRNAVRMMRALRSQAPDAATFQTKVPDLSGAIRVRNLVAPRGNGAPPRLDRINFDVAPGGCLAILGACGSGKSTLLGALAGLGDIPIGNVFLDETDVRTLAPETRDAAIGYLPQRVAMTAGTIAENISGFAGQRDDAQVLTAARLAGVHGVISALPNAYETDLSEEGYLLTAAQLHRVGFARAVYLRPKYLLLDEPNAVLDNEGERQMGDAIHRLKAAGTTVVMVLHRMALSGLADTALVLDRGKVVAYGPRAEVVGQLAQSHRRFQVDPMSVDRQDILDWVRGQFVRDGDDDFRHRAGVVACELLAAARATGQDGAKRMAEFGFAFVDDQSCSITLTEVGAPDIAAKIDMARDYVARDAGTTEDLGADVNALATVVRLSDRLEQVREGDHRRICASISADDQQRDAS